jgi:hypothetical protein
MHTLTTNRCILTCLIIAVIAVGALAGLDRYGRNSRVIGPSGTIQMQHSVKRQVESPRDAYQIWKDAGYRGHTVVFVADRWESFDPGELIPSQMYRAYPLPLYNTARLLEETKLNGTTFLYVASMNKIIRRIVAVVPEGEVARMKGVASTFKNTRFSHNGVLISRQGVPRWYTTGADFTGVDEPVLLYVGASYFKHAEPEELLHQLSSVGLQIDSVILCNEARKDTVTPDEVAKLDRFARLIGIAPSAVGAGGLTTSKAVIQQRPVPAL